MDDFKVDFPEVAGKTIAELLVYRGQEQELEFLLRFTDSTQLSVLLRVKHSIDARYCHEDSPDQPIFIRGDSETL